MPGPSEFERKEEEKTTPDDVYIQDALSSLHVAYSHLNNLQEVIPDLESRILWTVNDMKNLERILEQHLIDMGIL